MLILKSRFLMYLLKVGGLRISLSGREGFDLAYARFQADLSHHKNNK